MIDQYLFQQCFRAFESFIEEKSRTRFRSFASNPYTHENEGYKYNVCQVGQSKLQFTKWNKSAFGDGIIAKSVVQAIEQQHNNLVEWRGKYGPDKLPHRLLFKLEKHSPELSQLEATIYSLYHDDNDESIFTELVHIFGKKYSLLAYLFFLKDRSKYLPIAPVQFDSAFALLGVDFSTSHKCSWENYSSYLELIQDVQNLLNQYLASETSLLDAHSFLWIIASHISEIKDDAEMVEYKEISQTEREAITKARIGQGRFRKHLIDYWRQCAVTNCGELNLLKASHIIPWSKATLSDRINPYNGLLLSPSLDAAFDSGYISFDDKGHIVISKSLSDGDREALGLSVGMNLRKIDTRHKRPLEYHRGNVFIQG
jgi:predicted restriction endonuclease